MIALLIIFLNSFIVSVSCFPHFLIKRAAAEPTHEGSKNSNISKLYNPFEFFHPEEHIVYIIGACYVILFAFIKLGSEKEFNYCIFVRYKNCDLRSSKCSSCCSCSISSSCCRRYCAAHRMSAGSIFPESTFLVTVGILPAIFMLANKQTMSTGVLQPDVVFNVLLVPIIMSAAWVADKLTFYRNLGTILWFAIIGTIVNAAILMPFFYYGSHSRWGIFNKIDMDLVDSGMYAILICAVDPVAVLSVFEAIHVDKLVYNVVFGESLLNDGVAVVFFHAFVDAKSIPNIQFFESVGIIFCFFIYAFSISIIWAFVMAIVISFITKLFYHHQPIQFVVIFALNYFTYVIGDTIKGSGIISLFFCVLIQRQYVIANLSYTSQTIIQQLLIQLSLLSEGIIFILMGLTAFSADGLVKNTDVGFSFFLIFICYVSRYFVIYLLGTIANIFRNEKLDYKKALFIQSHGGLRGAIGFSLAYSLEEVFSNRYYYQSATAIMVFFSVYILGVTIKPLVRICKIPIEVHFDKTVFVSIQEKLTDRTKEGIKAILGSSSMRFRWEKYYTQMNNRYLKRWLMSHKSIERNVSHSSVVKLFRDQSISEAQSIASDHGSAMLKDMAYSNGDARIKLYKRTWSSYNSLPGTPKSHGSSPGVGGNKFQDEFDSHFSIPDMSVLDQTMTRRDVDDQMTHHNRQEGMGRKIYKKTDSFVRDFDKRRDKLGSIDDTADHRSHTYKHPARVIGYKTKQIQENPEDVLPTLQKKYNAAPKTNKSVKFDDIELSPVSPNITSPGKSNNNNVGKKPVFKFGDKEESISDLIDSRDVKFTLHDEDRGGYVNDAYESEFGRAQPYRVSNTKYDSWNAPPGGDEDDVILQSELPWQRANDDEAENPPQRSNEPIIPGSNNNQKLEIPSKDDFNKAHSSNLTVNPMASRRRLSSVSGPQPAPGTASLTGKEEEQRPHSAIPNIVIREPQ